MPRRSLDKFKQYLDFPVLLLYKYNDGHYSKSVTNVMTNGAWTWWWHSEKEHGTVHEISSHSTFTSAYAKMITEMSMIFLPPNRESVDILKLAGGVHGPEDKMATIATFLNNNDGLPSWRVKPIDVHRVPNRRITLITTQLVEIENGFPERRICDERRKFYELVKKPIRGA